MRGRTLSDALVIIDEKSNVLVYTIEKMNPFDITGPVTLEHVERSPLSKLAERSM